jgi:hypothetical protein
MGMILNRPITYELKEKGVFVKYELEEATYYTMKAYMAFPVQAEMFISTIKGKCPLSFLTAETRNLLIIL